MIKKSTCVVVVTYNRKELLKENISALVNQTCSIDKILVVNNCSTDGTDKLLNDLSKKYNNLEAYNMEKNIGGAGGFNQGLKIAYASNCDYIWIMDDDTIPEPDALENLLGKVSLNELENWSFLCSNVVWKDNKACLMNIPEVTHDWNYMLKFGLTKLKSTSFVSLLIKRQDIEKVGYPISQFFIWGDDVEYTKRLATLAPGYLVTDSVVTHKMNQNCDVNIVSEEKSRVDRYFYEYRNKSYTSRKSGLSSYVNYLNYVIKSITKVIIRKNDSKIKKVKVILQGFIKGIFFNPKIEFPEDI
ncbi:MULTISPECIES: glycosyltransferase family 2 protein [Clostridium]|uniref:glycosyltransferase family 2 protein n=1 Tax=Clostridium TaxID=1485 RepID=UPI00136EFDFF|nr:MULTISPECIES: glycosyltransferase family 2 protein [Clostridium]